MFATFANSIEFISHLSTDVLLIIFLIGIISIVSLYVGKDKILSFIFSLFIGETFMEVFPYEFGQSQSAPFSFGLVIIFALISTYILRRFIRAEFSYKKTRKYLQALLLGIVTTILLLGVGLVDLYSFSPTIAQWFTGKLLFWSLLTPFVLLFLFLKK